MKKQTDRKDKTKFALVFVHSIVTPSRLRVIHGADRLELSPEYDTGRFSDLSDGISRPGNVVESCFVSSWERGRVVRCLFTISSKHTRGSRAIFSTLPHKSHCGNTTRRHVRVRELRAVLPLKVQCACVAYENLLRKQNSDDRCKRTETIPLFAKLRATFPAKLYLAIFMKSLVWRRWLSCMWVYRGISTWNFIRRHTWLIRISKFSRKL